MSKSSSPSSHHNTFDPPLCQEMVAYALKLQEEQAALYLKYAKALQEHCPEQAAIFAKMGTKELEHFQESLRTACNIPAPTSELSSDEPTLSDISSNETNFQTAQEEDQTTSSQTQAYKQTLLTWIQPGLAGLMDGSVSTLAPTFAAAFATGDTYQTFLIGFSAAIGAGLSMGFTEAAHDDGKLSGRGSPLKRGIANGVMTMLGGLGHALPYLIDNFYLATTLACLIVFFELWAIVWIQNKFMATPFWRASFQVIVGGALVLATGILIGSI
ncbi:hypothetical protein GGR10_000561 [Bartonella chomelii]|uniref:Rubrerythrin family protein n=2 Tax=Bartonellaceae TaxID=772 RepID=A0ABR6E2B9_9HYPH|nr:MULTISPECIES: hypothetical protein [Bartonella]MBA9082720.1 hypothetical protein [Bartonella chomelii]